MSDASPSQARRQVGLLAVMGVVARLCSQTMLLVLLLLAGRFLTVELFGIFVLASILMNFGVIQMYSGIYHFVLREPAFEQSRGTAFTLQMLFSFAFALFILACSLGVYLLGWGDLLALLMAATAGMPVIALIASWQEAIRLREGDVKFYYAALIFSEITGSAVSVWMLIDGMGVWSLIANRYVASTIIAVALTWKSGRLPRPEWSREDAGSIVRFATPLYGNSALAYFTSSGADIVLGGFLSARAVGLFRMGSRTASAAFDLFAQTFRILTWQAVGRMAREQRLSAELWTSLLVINLSIMLFVLGSLSLLAHELVSVMLGGEWMAMVPVLQVLCWAKIITSADQIVSAQLAAAGHTAFLFRSRILEAAILLVALLVTVHFGILAVAFGMFPSAIVYVMRLVHKLTRLTDTTMISVARTILPGLALGASGLVVVFAASVLLEAQGPVITILITALVGVLTYVATAFVAMRGWTLRLLHTVSTAILPAKDSEPASS